MYLGQSHQAPPRGLGGNGGHGGDQRFGGGGREEGGDDRYYHLGQSHQAPPRGRGGLRGVGKRGYGGGEGHTEGQAGEGKAEDVQGRQGHRQDTLRQMGRGGCAVREEGRMFLID